MNESERSIEKWKEVTRGIYRCVFATSACYEIHLVYHDHSKDFHKAEARLYCAGDWTEKNGTNYFIREFLAAGTVDDCVAAAWADYQNSCT